MYIRIKEIEELISGFPPETQEELIEHYLRLSRQIIMDSKPIGRRKIELLKSNLRYMKESRKEYIMEAMKHKANQLRKTILISKNIDYMSVKKYISQPELWMVNVVREILDVFHFTDDVDQEIFLCFHSRLMEILKDTFLSCEKYRSGGNQLIMNIYSYMKEMKIYIDIEMEDVLEAFENNFQPNEYFGREKINEIYKEYASKK